MQWFEDWRMPRCFHTIEAGLGRAGLKVNNERYSVCEFRDVGCSGRNFFFEKRLIVATFHEISNEFLTVLIKESVWGAYAT